MAEEKKEELWFGKVIFAQYRNTINELNQPEITIEWLSQRVTPITTMTFTEITKATNPIKVKPTSEYFVTTIRTQEMKIELVKSLVKEANNINPTAAQLGSVEFVGTINNISAKYVNASGGGGVYDNVKLEVQ